MPEPSAAGRQTWLLFISRVPREPPGRRAYVWRQPRELGASYPRQAAAILPNQPAPRHALEALQARIAGYGGKTSLRETISPDAAWEQEAIARFNGTREAEYAELCENVERPEDEITRESRRHTFTFVELEDLEADWEKLARWRARIQARDFFAAPARTGADALLERARAALDALTNQVHAPAGYPARPLPPPAVRAGTGAA